jgi:ABC-type multidrug transport system fused ATPase/permease subunit
MLFVVSFAFVRSFFYWYKSYSHGLIVEAYQTYMRGLVIRWALIHTSWDSSRVVTLMNDRVQNTANLISGVHGALINASSGTVIFFYLLYTSWQLALFGIVALVGLGLGLRSFDAKIRKESHNVVRLSSEINARVLDSLRNLFFLRVCRFEQREAGLIEERFESLFQSTRLNFAISSVKFAAPQFLGVALIVLISLVAKEHSLLAGGAFLSFVYLFMRVSQLIAELSSSTATIRMYHPHFRELYAWFNAHHDEIFSREKAPESTGALAPVSWELKNISVSIGAKRIFTGGNFSIPAGKITILRGPSGVGKSTILSILAGFIEPQAGQVVRSGEAPIRFGYVGPEPAVISGTIQENLLFGLDSDPLEEAFLKSVLKVTSCTEFIDSNPLGLSRRISDRGEGLSTGQKQRLSVARALLRRPNVLLLDVPTASLDEKSKAAIVEALRSLNGTATIVIATHDDQIAKIADHLIALGAEAGSA